MKIEQRATDSLKPYARNPRKNEPAVDACAASIEAFGFRQPIVVDAKGVIVVGHTRWKAAKKLGLETVPVHVADLTPEQAKAYRIADNRTGEIADWDFDMLGEELRAIDKDLLGSLGWDVGELERLTEDRASVTGALREQDATCQDGFHRIMVECQSAVEMESLLAEFMERGLTCRSLIL